MPFDLIREEEMEWKKWVEKRKEISGEKKIT